MAVFLFGAGVALGGRAGRLAQLLALLALVGVAGVALVALAWVVWRRLGDLRRDRAAATDVENGLSHLADLVGLGLTAGHNVTGALSAVRPHIDGVLLREVDDVLRRARHRGAAGALASSTGHGAGLYRVMARSVETGASTLDAVTAFAAERRAEAHAAEIERARRLPVKLLFPLALLVLPGFTLVLLGPAMVGALDRLGL